MDFLDQLLAVAALAFARHQAEQQPALRVDGRVVPSIAAQAVERIVRVAVLLFLADEAPLVIDLDRAGLRGKKPPVLGGGGRRAPGEGQVAGHRVLVHLDQTTGGTRATALLDVPQHGAGLVVGKPRTLQDRALALGEVALAGAAVDHADALACAAPAAEGEISSAAHALIGAAGILATEVFKRVQ